MKMDESKFDLEGVLRRAESERFYGEMVIKWEDGNAIFLEVIQKFKPVNFRKVIFAMEMR